MHRGYSPGPVNSTVLSGLTGSRKILFSIVDRKSASPNRLYPARNAPSCELGELRALWRKLPSDLGKQDETRRRCAEMRDLAVRLRKKFTPRVDALSVKGISPGSQPLVLGGNRQLAAMHMRYPGDKPTPDLEAFCRVFPTEFFVSDRAPYFDPESAGQGRPLTAGFHLMQGYFRDDGPLYDLVLDEAGRRELDALWWELNFITGAAARQYKDFIFFERAEPPRFMRPAEFDFARSEDKDAISEAKIHQASRCLSRQGQDERGQRTSDQGHRDLLRGNRPFDPTSRAGSAVGGTQP